MACLTPVRIKAKKTRRGGNWDGVVEEGGHAIVPCNKCPECKKRRANAWIFRLLKEERIHQNSLFVTLTYDPKYVPISKAGYMTLRKKDYQNFMKRLRRITGIKTIKYYACGEYGSETMRPHYHAIMFDVPPDAIEKAWLATDANKNALGPMGTIYIGQVTGASVGYCTKYICKDSKIPMHAKDDRVREFALMSKNLGKCYLTPQMINWHKNNEASYVVVDGGYKQPLPRYYRDKIFSEAEREMMNNLTQLQRADDFEKAIAFYGSQKEYYRVQYENVRQTLLLNDAKTKRTKI